MTQFGFSKRELKGIQNSCWNLKKTENRLKTECFYDGTVEIHTVVCIDSTVQTNCKFNFLMLEEKDVRNH